MDLSSFSIANSEGKNAYSIQLVRQLLKMCITTLINIPSHEETVGQHQHKMKAGGVQVWVSRHMTTKLSYEPVVMTDVSLLATVYLLSVFHLRLQFHFHFQPNP